MKGSMQRTSYKLLALLCAPLSLCAWSQAVAQPELGYRSATLIQRDGFQFKDLNHDGELNKYEDWRLPAEERADDLLKQMSLPEKAGLMMHGTAPVSGNIIGSGAVYDKAASRDMILKAHVTSLLTRLNGEDPALLATQNNVLQEIAESGRLGIPVTVSTDPRNSYQDLVGISNPAGKFSQWPEAIGIGAAGSEELAREYASHIREEYRAVGITQALSPQADIATEPRWARISGTFGENPELARKLVRGYITGMQDGSDGLNSKSVAAVVKHWVGYGAAENGWDGHNAYGKNIVFKTNNLRQHIIPFEGAFESKVAAVMPTYSIIKGVEWNGKRPEPVAAGFSHFMLTDLLRDEYKFKGVIISDWLITADCNEECVHGTRGDKKPVPGGMPWGVEHLSKEQRFIKAVRAGIDQFGGVTDSDILVNAVKKGLLPEKRLDESARRILVQKFELGLFEQPYVDANNADKIVGSKATQQEADQAQLRSLVLLQNNNILPLRKATRVWLYGIKPAEAEHAGLKVVEHPEEADVAIMRVSAPFEQPHYGYFFGRRHHEGSLEYKLDNDVVKTLNKVSSTVPVIMTMYMERPAILTHITDKTHAFIANFGLSDQVLFNRLMSDSSYSGRLPFALPSNMKSVQEQDPSVPGDIVSPLYPTGFGLSR
ncbi:glycoside hydrolase family 3 protein [Klebsiella variicola]|uniref:glycoside hydrolase family 3 protein n=1 Tax=Klebsiella variicola TaxID=244366 RepID=UPI0035ABAB4D